MEPVVAEVGRNEESIKKSEQRRAGRKEERLRQRLESDTSSDRAAARLIELLVEDGRSDEALDVAVEALTSGSSGSSDFFRHVAQILSEGDMQANFGAFMGRIAADAPLSAIAKFNEHFRDIDFPSSVASTVLDRCAGEFASGSRQLLVKGTLAHACGDAEATRKYVQQALVAAGKQERRILKVVQTANALGCDDVVAAGRSQYESVTAPDDTGTPSGYNIVTKDGSMLGWNDACEEGVVIFKSFGRFWEASHPLVATLTQRKIASVTVVDVERLAYAHGFGDHFPDVAASTDALAALLAEQTSVKRWHTMGFSVGGWAALRYGAVLGVETATVFSGLSYLPLEQGDPDPRGRAVRRRGLNYQFGAGTDAREELLQSPDMQVRAVFAGSSGLDRMHAERIDDLDNVTIREVPGGSHAFWKGWSEADWVELVDDIGVGVASS